MIAKNFDDKWTYRFNFEIMSHDIRKRLIRYGHDTGTCGGDMFMGLVLTYGCSRTNDSLRTVIRTRNSGCFSQIKKVKLLSWYLESNYKNELLTRQAFFFQNMDHSNRTQNALKPWNRDISLNFEQFSRYEVFAAWIFTISKVSYNLSSMSEDFRYLLVFLKVSWRYLAWLLT